MNLLLNQFKIENKVLQFIKEMYIDAINLKTYICS